MTQISTLKATYINHRIPFSHLILLPLFMGCWEVLRLIRGDGREQASERVRGRLLVLGHSVSSRYVCADILYDRASEQGRGRECALCAANYEAGEREIVRSGW